MPREKRHMGVDLESRGPLGKLLRVPESCGSKRHNIGDMIFLNAVLGTDNLINYQIIKHTSPKGPCRFM